MAAADEANRICLTPVLHLELAELPHLHCAHLAVQQNCIEVTRRAFGIVLLQKVGPGLKLLLNV